MQSQIAKKIYANSYTLVILFLTLTATALFPFLFQGKFILSTDSDAIYYYYPIFEFYSQALKSNDSFLWNPLIFSGFPTYLSQTGGFFDPVNFFLFKTFPSPLAYHMRLFIDLFLTLLFSYLAGKALNLSTLASSLIGFGYILAFHWRFLSNIVIANTLFIMPFSLWVFLKSINAPGFRKWLWASAGGVGLGWALLSGYTQIIFYAMFLLGIFSLLYTIVLYYQENTPKKQSASPKKGLLRHYFFTLLLVFFLINVIGAILGLPQILPAMAHIPLSTRAGGLEFSQTTLKSIKAGDAILFFLPDYLYFPYLSVGRKPLYIGAFWFLAAVAGLILAKRKPLILGIAVLFLFAFIASLKGSPLFYLLQNLPFFKYFRFPFRWMYLGAFFFSILGAYGFDSLPAFIHKKSLRLTFYAIGAIVIGIIALVLFFNFLNDITAFKVSTLLDSLLAKTLYGNLGFIKDPAHYKEAVLRGINSWREFTSLKEISFVVPFVLLILSYTLFLGLFFQKISLNYFRLFGFFITILTFLVIFAVQWKNSLPLNITKLHQKLLADIISEKDRLLYRTYPIFLDNAFQKIAPPQFALSHKELIALTEMQFATGRPNMHMYSKIASVDGYDQFIPQQHYNIFEKIGSSVGIEKNNSKEALKNLDIIGMMSGKYIISGAKLNHPDLKFLALKTSQVPAPLYIYENKKALPKLYFAQNTKFIPHKSLTELLAQNFRDFAEVSYIDCKICQENSLKGKAEFEIVSARNGFYYLRTKSSLQQWLIVSESFLPGWEAKIDGKQVSLFRVNGLYMAVLVPAGRHNVILEYNGIIKEAKLLKKFGIIKR